MAVRRPVWPARELTSGPAKLCQALGIDRALDGADLCSRQSPLYIGEHPAVADFVRLRGPVVTSTRIGISAAASLPLRFYLGGSHAVSRRLGTGGEKTGRG